MSEEKIESFHCAACGIQFGITKSVVTAWRKTHKKFVCPNGDSLSFDDKTADEKELSALRIEVVELKKQLAEAVAEAALQKSKVEKLTSELEIYGIQNTEQA